MKKIIGMTFIYLFICNFAFTKEILSIPIYVHIVDIDENIKETHYEMDANAKIKFSIKLAPYKTSVTKEIVKKDFIQINRIWSQADIRFNIKDINFTKAETKNLKKYSELSFKNYYNKKYIDTSLEYHLEIIDHKRHDNDNGINVYYIPKMLTSICGAWDNNNNIMFIGSKEEKLFDPNVKLYWQCDRIETLAHEFGHTVQLDHSDVSHNIMMSSGLDVDMGTNLTKKQITEAREFLKKVLGL